MSATRGLVMCSASAALLLVLTGCITINVSPEPTGTTEPAPAPSESVEPAPTTEPVAEPDPAPAGLVIPDCDAVLPIREARTIFHTSTVLLGERTPSEISSAFSANLVAGMLDSADPALACTWGVPNSGGAFTGVIASLTKTQSVLLQDDLAGAGFRGSGRGEVRHFLQEKAVPDGSVAETHLFLGKAWVFVEAPTLSTSDEIAALLLQSVNAANTTLDF